jgi:DNA-binding XRE family transcriptional regulator
MLFSATMVTDFIERVRAALKQDGVTAAGLAKKAGLHRNTLYGAEREDWNPTRTSSKRSSRTSKRSSAANGKSRRPMSRKSKYGILATTPSVSYFGQSDAVAQAVLPVTALLDR